MCADVHNELLLITTAKYNILPLTSNCNLNCVFCSHSSNPSPVQVWRTKPVSMETVSDMLDYLDGSRKIVIGESATRLIEGEPLTHPDFITIIQEVRSRFPRTKIEITTNGSLLTEKIIEDLAGLQPLEINLSLNSASREGRSRLMNDNNPGTAIRAPILLHHAGIDYNGSLVALPDITGWNDFRETISYLSSSGARTIRVFLPGFSRLNVLHNTANIHELRRHLDKELEFLRDYTDVPLLLEPPYLEDLTPVIEGVTANSPASAAGLKRGDIVLQVDRAKPRSRVEAYRMTSKPGRHLLQIYRENVEIPFTIEVGEKGSGLTFLWDMDIDSVLKIKKIGFAGRDVKVLVITSPLAAKVVAKALKSFNVKTEILTVPCDFFGGSISCAGLLTLHDMKKALRQKEISPFDFLFIPAVAFDCRGNDLTGENYRCLEEEFKIPIVLV